MSYFFHSFFSRVSFAGVPFIMLPHGVYAYSTHQNRPIETKEKYMFSQHGYSKYMVVDSKNMHYCVNNSFWYFKYDSLEDWNSIQPSQTLFVKMYGIRIPWLGIFPNIVGIYSKDGENKPFEIFREHFISIP